MTNLKHILRQLWRQKRYATINVVGMGIGIGCVVLMLVFLIHEFSFDRFHEKSDKLYRVVDGRNCQVVYAMGEAFKKEIPEIENLARFKFIQQVQIIDDENSFAENDLLATDASLLNMLDFKFIAKQKDDLLIDKNSILISEKMAKKYFPNSNAVGGWLKIKYKNAEKLFKVAGVFADLPSYSSLRANFICNIENAFDYETIVDIGYEIGFNKSKPKRDYLNEWSFNEFICFIELSENADIGQIEAKCEEVCLEYREENPAEGINLQAFTDMYLQSETLEGAWYFKTNQLKSLKIFTAIGLLILLIACVNFISIQNSDMVNLRVEIASRIVNGASRKDILMLFVLKSVLVAFMSLVPALVFVKLMLPFFNTYFDNELNFDLLLNLPYAASVFGAVLLCGLSSGLIVGLRSTSISPVLLMNGGVRRKSRGRNSNGLFVLFQFGIFILLFTSASFMYKQYEFSIHKYLGFDTENVLIFNFESKVLSDKIHVLNNELQQNPNVISSVPTSFMTPPTNSRLLVSYKDEETDESVEQEVLIIGAGEIELLNIPLVEGETFREGNNADMSKILINEAAARKYEVSAGDKLAHYIVQGVVADFNFHSIHSAIEPVFIVQQSTNFSNIIVKTNGQNAAITKFVEETCKQHLSSYILKYETLDERIVDFYKQEENQMGVIAFFTIIALCLSVLGLIGFVSMRLSQSTKEIGIRKVNGAKTSEILNMLTVEYAKWVVISFVLAMPVVYFLVKRWMQSFAYRTELSWWIFAVTGILTLLVTSATVVTLALRTANKNPVEAIKYE